ncbi:MAG TPA: sarcosine oxidase subunit alpha family protein [Beijerinckiaceae bacterium]|nr:sarcosine oxidase subunit alpha family protein [Beijerinckiaceae bacterium]
MKQSFRTAAGGRIDRTSPLRFSFDGLTYRGFKGDTLASALLANGVHFVGRSYKYHRPRGILSAGIEEPNALVSVHRGKGRMTPNLRATEVPLHDGLEARSQNNWPSLGLDIGAINDRFSRFLSAGFYYKTFMGPKMAGTTLWTRLFEPIVRHAAGLGARPVDPDPDRYVQYYDHCDVLVVGGGPSGLAAALAAGEAGADVILCDEQSELGGSLLAEARCGIDGQDAAIWRDATLSRLMQLPNVRLLPRTQGFGLYGHNLVGLVERMDDSGPAPGERPSQRLWQVRAGRVVLATGAIERPLVFSGNDRPGIILADAARIYLNRYGVRVGSRIVVVTAHDSAYRAALDLHQAGITVAAICDLRPAARGALPAEARAAGLKVIEEAIVDGTRGRRRVSGVLIRAGADERVGQAMELDCDAVLMSAGWTPSLHLSSQARQTPRWDAERQLFLPGGGNSGIVSVGACNGVFGLAEALAEGHAAGCASTGQAPGRHFAVTGDPPQTGGWLGLQPGDTDSGEAFVDFQNDVKAADIELAVREGYRSIEHVKRYTTTGMATDQGKTSNLNALAIAARALGRSLPDVGLTTFRQPYTPVAFGALAGAHRDALFEPVRHTPMHDLAAAAGAVFEDVGQWKRARYFPQHNEDLHAAVARECRAVRQAVGLFDASTLGKIEVCGPDAATFLERIYCTPVASLRPGRCRYGLMLGETGFLMDDGVFARLDVNRFYLTTTTGGAARVLHHMEDYRQTEWPDLDVWLTSVTEQWAVVAVQGPRARDLLAPLIQGFDIAAAAMPHMAIQEGQVAGIPARVLRVSFTGELGFEVHVPAGYGRALWQVLRQAGEGHRAVTYGTEAMHVLRAEKGYIIVGQETDGTVTPQDLGLAWAVGKSKGEFIGRRSLKRPDLVACGRKQLVGLLTDNPAVVLDEGAQLTASAHPAPGSAALGHVTSSYWSAALGRSIALALLAEGRARQGEGLFASTLSGSVPVRVTAPVFVDPEGSRLHG